MKLLLKLTFICLPTRVQLGEFLGFKEKVTFERNFHHGCIDESDFDSFDSNLGAFPW
jgi:hypothetical protein